VTPNQNVPRILSIAGSDSSGGAGIQADIKTIMALGGHGMTAITAVTAQNSLGVTAVQAISPAMVTAQIDAVVTDIGVDAVKIGMLGSAETVRAVAQALGGHRIGCIVLDPVLRTTSGHDLGDETTATAIVKYLFPLAALVTPNLDEASIFLGRRVQYQDELNRAGQDLLDLGAKAVLLKGGHLPVADGESMVDVLVTPHGVHRFTHPKIPTRNAHGTGCTLAAAIATRMAANCALHDAVDSAIRYVQGALRAGAQLHLGHGSGPLWHMHEQ
jgi:hydroxymethylpyrimidine/phosphomethylpyrimidine kinase